MPTFQTEPKVLTTGRRGTKRSILTRWCRDPLRSLAPHCPEESPESSQWRLASLYLALALWEDINGKSWHDMTVVRVCVWVLPVRITRLCCLCSMLFFSPFSAGRSGGISGRGSDLGSSGVTAGSLKPFSSPFSFGSSTEDLQGRRPIGCPLRPMYLQAERQCTE